MSDQEDKKKRGQAFLDFANALPPLPTRLMAVSCFGCTSKKRSPTCPVHGGTKVVNVKHVKEYDTYIGRPSVFGNSHPVGRVCPVCTTVHQSIIHVRGEAVDFYKKDFLEMVDLDPEFRQSVLGLRGKTLGCHCRHKDGIGGKCHGDVIVEWLNTHSE